MKSFGSTLAALLCIGALSCSKGAPVSPRLESRLVVFVHWDQVGLADRRIVLVELEQERRTDQTGIAEFLARPGTYTVRAYGITGPGPGLDIEREVTLVAGRTYRLEIVDCLPCVTPD